MYEINKKLVCLFDLENRRKRERQGFSGIDVDNIQLGLK
jgi:hypothetical protein